MYVYHEGDKSFEVSTNETEAILTGLQPGSRYTFDMWTVGDRGQRSSIPAAIHESTGE